MSEKGNENLGYTIAEPKKGSKIVNIIAPLVLLGSFIIGVGYASVSLMGNRNDNYLEKVEQMKKDDSTTTVSSEAEALVD